MSQFNSRGMTPAERGQERTYGGKYVLRDDKLAALRKPPSPYDRGPETIPDADYPKGICTTWPFWCPTCRRTSWYELGTPLEKEGYDKCCLDEMNARFEREGSPSNVGTKWWLTLYAQGEERAEAEGNAEPFEKEPHTWNAMIGHLETLRKDMEAARSNLEDRIEQLSACIPTNTGGRLISLFRLTSELEGRVEEMEQNITSVNRKVLHLDKDVEDLGWPEPEPPAGPSPGQASGDGSLADSIGMPANEPLIDTRTTQLEERMNAAEQKLGTTYRRPKDIAELSGRIGQLDQQTVPDLEERLVGLESARPLPENSGGAQGLAESIQSMTRRIASVEDEWASLLADLKSQYALDMKDNSRLISIHNRVGSLKKAVTDGLYAQSERIVGLEKKLVSQMVEVVARADHHAIYMRANRKTLAGLAPKKATRKKVAKSKKKAAKRRKRTHV